MDNRKSLIIKISGAIVGLLLVLTFFSNTIYSINVAGVVVGFAQTGTVASTIRSEGVLDFPENIGIYAEYAGRLVLISREGDRVAEGDALFAIHTDTESILERLELDNNRLTRATLGIEQNRSDLAAAQSQLASLTLHPTLIREVQAPDLSAFEHEETRLATEIIRAEEHLQSMQTLFAAGAVPRVQLDTAQHALDNLQANRQRNTELRDLAITNYQQNLAQVAEENRIVSEQQDRVHQNERIAINSRIEGLQHSIQLLMLEEAEARRLIARHQDQLDAGGVVTVYAPYDGIVREAPNAPGSNSFVDRGRNIMRLGIHPEPPEGREREYIVTAYFPDNFRPTPASGTRRSVRIDIPAFAEFGISANIQRVTPQGNRMRAEIAFMTDLPVMGGERIMVVVEEFAPTMGQMLPNHAIREDGTGNFILYAERVSNTLIGYSFYARRENINVTHRGDTTSSFNIVEVPRGSIIIRSDRPIAEGDRIRLIGEQ